MGAFMALPVAALITSFISHYGRSYDVVYHSIYEDPSELDEDGGGEDSADDGPTGADGSGGDSAKTGDAPSGASTDTPAGDDS
jgi:hypothetical protein